MADTRLTLRQAAAVLGVSESAIRKRVERGTLRSDKGLDGRRYVYLDTVADSVADEGADTSAPHEHDALISELRAHNDTLREQLEAERQAHAEARRIIAGLVERVPPALEAPTDAPGSPTAGEQGEGDGVDVEIPLPLRRLLAVGFFLTFVGLFVLTIAASGESVAALFSSVERAFATAIASGLSEVSGDQAAIIVSSIIALVGPITAAYIGIRASRGGRN